MEDLAPVLRAKPALTTLPCIIQCRSLVLGCALLSEAGAQLRGEHPRACSTGDVPASHVVDTQLMFI